MSELIKSPVKAIRAKCVDCTCGQLAEVAKCPATSCPLYAFRFGKNPYIKRVLSDEERLIKAEQMRNIARKHN